MNESEAPAARSHATLWAMGLPSVLLLYLLFPGAYVAAQFRGGWKPGEEMGEALNSVYAPVQWVLRRSETLDHYYSTFLGVCAGLSPSDFRLYGQHLSAPPP